MASLLITTRACVYHAAGASRTQLLDKAKGMSLSDCSAVKSLKEWSRELLRKLLVTELVSRVNCYWSSPAQSFLMSSPAGLMTKILLSHDSGRAVTSPLKQSHGRHTHQGILGTHIYVCVCNGRNPQISVSSSKLRDIEKLFTINKCPAWGQVQENCQILPLCAWVRVHINLFPH